MDTVKILSEGRGEIQVLKDNEASTLEVNLGRIVGASAEILSDVPDDTKVILTNLSNFDPKKSALKVE